MSACLRPDEFIDALDGVLPASRRAHVEGCAACRATLQDVSAALRDAQGDEVPEPSPYFWPSINARVAAAVAETPPAPGRWRWWPLLVPAASLAGLVFALSSSLAGGSGAGLAEAPALESVLPAEPADAIDDPALALVVDLATLIGDDAEPLPLSPIGDLGEVAARTLTADEQEALQTLLRTAVDRPPS